MRCRRLSASMVLVCMLLCTLSVYAQEAPPDPPPPAKKKTDGYISLFLLGTMPQNKNLRVDGTEISQTSVKGSMGAGVKAAIFPRVAGGVFGVEGEIFGHGGKVSAPFSALSGAQGDLAVVNFMVNVLARYPGEVLQPYIGVGIGLSAASLRDATIQTGGMALSGKANDGAFAYQFLAGARAYVSSRVFLFGEYKYFAADYSWKSEGVNVAGNPTTKLDFRTQIIAGGVGFAF
jgi:opacity protein-like surface antigen